MSTKYENASHEQYAFRYKEEPLKNILTYRINLIREIEKAAIESGQPIPFEFTGTSITQKKFQEFIRVAAQAGYSIYRVIKQ